MRRIDIENVLRLRHVSRTFMRLFHTDATFAAYQLKREDNVARFSYATRVWAAPNVLVQNQFSSWLRPACENCQRLLGWNPGSPETILNMPSLACAPCHRRHGLPHFSEAQQQEQDCERRCRGHESQFTLCDHISLNLQQIKWYARLGTGVIIPCGRKHERKSIKCHKPTCANLGRPDVRIKYEPDGNISMDIMLSLHFQLKRLPSGKICGNSLRDELRQLEESEKDRPWVPIFAFASGNLLRAFDPNLCDCVDWFGDSSKQQNRHHSELPLRSPATLEYGRDARYPFYTSTEGRCAFMSHRFSFRSAGLGCDVDILPCASKPDLAVVFQRLYFLIQPTAPAAPAFRYFLDGAPMACAPSGCTSVDCGARQLQRFAVDLSNIMLQERQQRRSSLGLSN